MSRLLTEVQFKNTKRISLSKRQKAEILLKQGSKCIYCGSPLDEWVLYKRKPYKLTPHFDHLLPYSFCYNSDVKNMAAACRFCNAIKHNKVFDTFEAAKEFVMAERVRKGLSKPEKKRDPEVTALQRELRELRKLSAELEPSEDYKKKYNMAE